MIIANPAELFAKLPNLPRHCRVIVVRRECFCSFLRGPNWAVFVAGFQWGDTWRIIPLSKWLLTMVTRSPR